MTSRPRLTRIFAAVLLIVLVYAGIVTALHAQSTPATLTNDPLLAEVRGLRADLHQAAGASIRAQLLVARLQLQEQRIAVLSGQLAEIRRQLTAKQAEVTAGSEQVKRLEEALRGSSMSTEQRSEVDSHMPYVKASLAESRRQEARLRSQENDLVNQIATEQGRWTDFNNRLDDLERQLPAR